MKEFTFISICLFLIIESSQSHTLKLPAATKENAGKAASASVQRELPKGVASVGSFLSAAKKQSGSSKSGPDSPTIVNNYIYVVGDFNYYNSGLKVGTVSNRTNGNNSSNATRDRDSELPDDDDDYEDQDPKQWNQAGGRRLTISSAKPTTTEHTTVAPSKS